MAYDTQELENIAVEAIKNNRLFFTEDVLAYLPCSRQTFYDHKLDKSENIKRELLKQRIEIKVSMRSKWYKSSAPALQIALMKLIATDAERKRMSQTYTDVTSDGEKVQPVLVEFINEKPEEDTDTE